ncbi:MAG: hypothetical protein H7A24_09940 [Leptospiraceae bacterium]|nr:hypothetical protein [Leptospiraceae bacterium]MCP5512190.1 hypothetical protein [Leptospiraceae bacterium]
MKNSRQLYSFYAEPLFQFWKLGKNKRKLEELYALLGRLYYKKDSEESRSSSTVKNYFIRQNKHILPAEYLPGVSCLLLETDFYRIFLDVFLPHRYESLPEYNNLFLKLSNFHNLSELKNETFWSRWIDMMKLQGSSPNHENLMKWNQFFDFHSQTSNRKHFLRELRIIKNSYSNQLYKFLNVREAILQNFFSISLSIYYSSFLKNVYHSNYKLNHIDLNREEFTLRWKKAQNIGIESTKALSESLRAFSDENLYFKEEFQILGILLEGNSMLGSQFLPFADLDFKERNKLIQNGEIFAQNLQPGLESSFHYHIHYKYYRFLHEFRVLGHLRIQKYSVKAYDLTQKLIEDLNHLEEICNGGYLKLLIKVQRFKKLIHNIQLDIKIFSLMDKGNYSFREDPKLYSDLNEIHYCFPNSSNENPFRFLE